MVLAVVPNSQPVLQIIYITSVIIFSFWFTYYAEKFMDKPVFLKPFYYKFVGWGSIVACITHTYGISTWLILKP